MPLLFLLQSETDSEISPQGGFGFAKVPGQGIPCNTRLQWLAPRSSEQCVFLEKSGRQVKETEMPRERERDGARYSKEISTLYVKGYPLFSVPLLIKPARIKYTA